MTEFVNRPLRLKPRSGLAVQYAAIRALFLRELQTRFGHYRLGYLWAILEPGLIIAFKLILFNTIRERMAPGIEFSVFLIVGVCLFYMVMRSMTKNLGVVASNRGLFIYRSVKPIDAIIARTFLEFCLYFFCFIVFSLLLIWSGYHLNFSHIPFFFLIWVVMFFLALGLAMIMAVIGDLSPEISKFISGSMIVFYLMSGLLFSINSIPEKFLPYILWNPVVHGLEYARWAVSPTYSTQYVSFWYLCVCTLIVFFSGLLLYKVREKDMLKSK
ncbi:MAG: ABC transporter permease [Moraxellaceae bacterium]|nr:MAG: ABC transporter permease [Moraxellaceae bacterium]